MSLGRETAKAVKAEGEAAPKKTRAKKAVAAEAAESAAPVVEDALATDPAAHATEGEKHPAFADEAQDPEEAQA